MERLDEHPLGPPGQPRLAEPGIVALSKFFAKKQQVTAHSESYSSGGVEAMSKSNEAVEGGARLHGADERSTNTRLHTLSEGI